MPPFAAMLTALLVTWQSDSLENSSGLEKLKRAVEYWRSGDNEDARSWQGASTQRFVLLSDVTPSGDSPLSGRAPGPRLLWERGPQPEESSPECSSPRPGLVQAQDESSPTPHEDGANVQQPVAERLRLGHLELAAETGHLRPGDER